MKPFEYSPRDSCICGATLDPGGARVARRYPPGEVSFLRCPGCASWCQSPRVTAATLVPWIESPAYFGSQGTPGAAYRDYLADEPQRLREAEDRWRRTLRHLASPGSSVLEIGCATGSVLRVLRERGCEVAGIDVSREFAEFARRQHGLEVRRCDFPACELGAQRFDLILLLGTLQRAAAARIADEDARAPLCRRRGAVQFSGRRALARARLRPSLLDVRADDRRVSHAAGLRGGPAPGRPAAARPPDRPPAAEPGKLLKHARLDPLLEAAARLGVEHYSLPFALALPGIRLARAVAEAAA